MSLDVTIRPERPPCAGCRHLHVNHLDHDGACTVRSCSCCEYLAELPNIARPEEPT